MYMSVLTSRAHLKMLVHWIDLLELLIKINWFKIEHLRLILKCCLLKIIETRHEILPVTDTEQDFPWTNLQKQSKFD